MFGVGLGDLMNSTATFGGGGGSGIPIETTPISDVTISRATTGVYTLDMWQGLTGGTPWAFCSTPPIGATFRLGRYMDWNYNDMMLGKHEIIIFAWNASGLMERTRFFITVDPPTTLTECKFGALTLAAAGKINTAKLPGGPLTPSTVYAGAWGSFTTDASSYMSPTAATLVAGSYTIGTLSVPVVIVAGEYTVIDQTEALAAGAAAGGFSGKTIKLRGHAASGLSIPLSITTTPSTWQDKFNALAALCTIAGADLNDRPVLNRFSVYSGGGTPNNLRLTGLAFQRLTTLQDKNATQTVTNMVLVQNGATNIRIDHCDFNENWYVGRIANLRPTERFYEIETASGVGVLIELNRFTQVFSPWFNDISSYGPIFRFNTSHMVFDDSWYNQGTDSAGPTYAGAQIYGNVTAHETGDSGFHADAGGHFSPKRANFDASNQAIYGNITIGGWEKLMGYPWPTVTSMPAAATIQASTNQSPAFSKFKAEMAPGAGNTITLTLPALTGVGTVWITATSYIVGDFVRQGGAFYRCQTAHTSGVFATDLAAARWSEALSCVQKMYRGGTLNVVVADGSSMAWTGRGSATSWSLTNPGMFLRLTPNSTTNLWGLNQEFHATQILFMEAPFTNPFKHVNLKLQHNIFTGTTKPIDLRLQTAASVLGNWLPPLFPGDLYNKGTFNDFQSDIDDQDDHSGILNGSGYRYMGNGPFPVDVNGSRLTPNPLNFQPWNTAATKTLAEMDAAVKITSTLLGNMPNCYCPMSPAEAIEMSRPLANSVYQRSGAGPMFGASAANDGFKLDGAGHLNDVSGLPWGRVDTKPWKVVGFNVVAINGGFIATWNEPAFIEDGAITNYRLEYRINGGAWVDLLVGTALTGFFENGTTGQSIEVRVFADNVNGTGTGTSWPTPIVVTRAKSALIPTFSELSRQVFNAAGNGANTSIYNHTLTAPPGGTKPLVIIAGLRTSGTGDPTIDAATLNGVALSGWVGKAAAVTENISVHMWYVPTASVSTGAGQVLSLDFSQAGNSAEVLVLEVTDGAATNLFGNTANGGSGTNLTTRTITLSATAGTKSAILNTFICENNSAVTHDAVDLPTAFNVSPNTTHRTVVAREDAATFGSYSVIFTYTSGASAAIAVEIFGAP
jgi:hypothetical protein